MGIDDDNHHHHHHHHHAESSAYRLLHTGSFLGLPFNSEDGVDVPPKRPFPLTVYKAFMSQKTEAIMVKKIRVPKYGIP
jgi:hypothetical protein